MKKLLTLYQMIVKPSEEKAEIELAEKIERKLAERGIVSKKISTFLSKILLSLDKNPNIEELEIVFPQPNRQDPVILYKKTPIAWIL